ncbi:MAG: translation initiation factor IF-3 [Mycoplasmatales bacterium]
MKDNRKSNKDIINEQIRAKELRVIGTNGEQLGTISKTEALNKAYDAELDLVLISPGANPPVAKIMDYGKYRYEKQKKDKENKQKQRQKAINLKLIRVSPTIDSHDYNTKIKQATKFLNKGDKVQFSIRFKGRMITHTELGLEVLNRIIEELKEISIVEQRPKIDGRKMYTTLASNIKK